MFYHPNDFKQQQIEWLQTNAMPNKDSSFQFPNNSKHQSSKKQSKPSTKPVWFLDDEKVDLELDLHGLAIEEAMILVERELELAVKSNYRIIRVIHGSNKQTKDCIYNYFFTNIKGKWNRYINKHRFDNHNRGATLLYTKV